MPSFTIRRYIRSVRDICQRRWWCRAQAGQNVAVHSSIEFTGVSQPYDLIIIGAGSKIERDTTIWFSPNHGANPHLSIGNQVFIGRNVYLGVYQPIIIGSSALIGAYSYIISANHCYDSRAVPIINQGFIGLPIVIGDDVWIGTHVVVLPGVTIGTGAIVAASSVVNRDIPPYEIWGGTPARFLKMRPE